MKILRLLARFDGSAVFAVFILGTFVYGIHWMNREGARAVRMEDVRGRILAYVKRQPGPEPVSLDDLHQAGVLSSEDLDWIRKNDVVYHPLSSQSPDGTLFFVARRGNFESRYFTGGRMDYVATWPSPDQSHALVSAPNPHDRSTRTVSVVDQASQRVLLSRDTTASGVLANEALWSPDGNFVAVNLSIKKPGTMQNVIDCAFLFEVANNHVQCVSLPDEIQPERLLDPANAAQLAQWYDNWVMATGWRGNRTLLMETQGRGRIGDPREGQAFSFNLIYRFELSVHNGAASISKKTRKHYAQSECK